MTNYHGDKLRKARKTHECSLCGKEIEKGSTYLVCHYIDDRGFHELKYHTECELIIEEYGSDTGESEYDYEGIAEWWSDTKCHACKRRYVMECSPDCCNWFDQRRAGKNCEERTRDGMCSVGETCDIMDHGCWCSMFAKEDT